MGDIKRFKKKYSTPMHPWNATRIQLEREIRSKYGVANKREIWKMESTLTAFKDQAKELLTRTDAQATIERVQMQERMVRLGLVKGGSGMDDILGLQLRDIMNRRLQTIVLKRRMARSVRHARQLIVHEHVTVAGKKITSPSYLVPLGDEATVSYAADSPFLRPDHAEAYSDELMQRRHQKQRMKDKKRGAKTEEIVVFDEATIADEDAKTKDADASVSGLIESPEVEKA